MSSQTYSLTPAVYQYLLDVSLREHEVLKTLRTKTLEIPDAIMQISPEQGQFMQLLVRLLGATKIIELGVFTGYSALSMALALPEDGRILACDISEEWTSIAREYWQKAGVGHKIDLRLAPGLETLQSLLTASQAGTFDMAFIDADKENYINYYEACLSLLRPNGLILIDNTLWGGKVIDPDIKDVETNGIQAFNRHIYADDRVDISLLPIGDGLTLARKR